MAPIPTTPRITTMAGPDERQAFADRLRNAGERLLVAAGDRPASTRDEQRDGAPDALQTLLAYAKGEERLGDRQLRTALHHVVEALDLLASPERPADDTAPQFRSFDVEDRAGLVVEAALCRWSIGKGWNVSARRLGALAGVTAHQIRLAAKQGRLATRRGGGKEGVITNESARAWLAERGIKVGGNHQRGRRGDRNGVDHAI